MEDSQRGAAGEGTGEDVDAATRRRWHYSRDELRCSPSISDGYSIEQESAARRDAVDYLGRAFDALLREKLIRRETVALAMLLFHRFYARRSMCTHDRLLYATASMMLACKLDARPRYTTELLNVYAEREGSAPGPLDPRSERGVLLRESLIAAERTLLYVLEYDVGPHAVALPYEFIPMHASTVALGDADVERQAVLAVNSIVRTTLVLQYSPDELAQAAVLVAARLKRIPAPPGTLPLPPSALHDILAQLHEQAGGGGGPAAAQGGRAGASAPAAASAPAGGAEIARDATAR